MCYGADRLARCEANNGKVRKKQAPQCCTGFKACFSIRQTTLDARSLLHRRRTSTASQQALGGGARGARRLRHHHRLHSAGSRPVAGLGRPDGRSTAGRPRARIASTSTLYELRPGSRLWGGGWRGARWRGPPSSRCSTGRRPAAGLGRWWGGGRLGARWRGPPLCPAGRRQAVGCGWLVRRLAVAGCWGATPSIPPSHVTTAHPLNCPHPHIATPHAPTYSLTQVLGWNRAPILTGPHPRSRRPSGTPHHIPPAHLNTHPSLTHPSIVNGVRSPLWGSTFSPAGPLPIFLLP